MYHAMSKECVIQLGSFTLAHHRCILVVVTRVSHYPIVRTLQHPLLTASAVQVIHVDGPYSLSVDSLSSNGS